MKKKDSAMRSRCMIVALVLLVVFGLVPNQVSGQTTTLTATLDIWIWEDNPDSTMEFDYVSVWSTASPENRRYGIVEFDLSSLPPGPFTDATLRLWALSDWFSWIAQSAEAIDTSLGTPTSALTWNIYQDEYAGTGMAFNSLGRVTFFPATPAELDRFVSSEADPADLAILEGIRQSTGILTLVMIADEDGIDYHMDWGDGLHGGMQAELVFNAQIFTDGFESGDTTSWTSTVPRYCCSETALGAHS